MKLKFSLLIIFVVAGFAYLPLYAQDLQLWYPQPAIKWTEALPIGNGRIGAMVFGDVQNDRIQFNEENLWTGEPRNHIKPGAYRYLDTIRQLLFAGKQKEADALAAREFMGVKSSEGSRDTWITDMKQLKGMKGNPALEKYPDNHWKKMQVPSYEGWEAVGFEGMDGALWFRTNFTLPASWDGTDLVLDLNRIRDQDLTYLNGKLVGSQENTEARRYKVPGALLKRGNNTLAIQVLNFSDKGGIAGYKDTTRQIGVYQAGKAEPLVPLKGEWKYQVQSDEPPPVGAYQASYQPFGDLHIRTTHTDAHNYRRSLDLTNAVTTTSYSFKGVTYKREYFVSAPQQAMVVQLTATRNGSIDTELELSSPHKSYSITKIGNNSLVLKVKVKHGALHGESRLQVDTDGGKVTIKDNKIVISGANSATLYLVAATNFNSYKDVTADPSAICKSTLQKINGKAYAQIKQAHIIDYQQYFNTFSIRLGDDQYNDLPTDQRIEQFAGTTDPAFVALYLQYGRYLLISSSRPGTRPANLQGIWNDLLAPPWGSKYTTNINAEMNYWPAELLNLSRLHQPLFGMIKELSETGRQTAKAYYNAPGWVLHHNTDAWRGTAPINAANHGIWVTGGAWMSQHLWEHYTYTQRRSFLADTAYPIMKEAALFFNHHLVKDPVSGFLISTPSNSPEQGGLVAGPTMDHQIIRHLFKNVISASTLLNVDATLRKTLEEKYAQIAPNRIGKYGQLQEWMEDVDDTTNKHRHVSHLWGQYPGNEINWDETPELMKAARQSLLYRGDAATGWSLGWKINLWARFKDGDHAFHMIKMLISPAAKNGAGSYPNLFDAHPPFQIDGNFGGAAGIGEMLLQSHTGFIDLLPALPAALPEGDTRGLCARGGFQINLNWANGQLTAAAVTSLAGNELVLRYQGKIVRMKTQKGQTYTFNEKLGLVK